MVLSHVQSYPASSSRQSPHCRRRMYIIKLSTRQRAGKGIVVAELSWVGYQLGSSSVLSIVHRRTLSSESPSRPVCTFSRHTERARFFLRLCHCVAVVSSVGRSLVGFPNRL